MQKIQSKDIENFAGIISKAKTFSIITHMNPDGDAFGSTLALQNYLEKCHGKDAVIADADPAPDSLKFMFKDYDANKFLVHKEQKELTEKRLKDSDVIICLDFNSPARAGSLEQSILDSNATKVLIDHHLSPKRECFDLVFSETEISSASELLFYVLMSMPDINNDVKKLPIESCNALMVGLTTDTNNFGNSVFPTTLSMASSLLEAGVDRNGILVEIYNRYRENRIRLMGHLMSNVLKITDYGVAYIILDQKTKDQYDTIEGETEGFVNMPLTIDNVKMSLFLKEDDGKMRVSIRSKLGISANRCAREFFNGGGHEQAAGGKLAIPEDIASVECAEQYILDATAKFFGL